MIGIELHQQSFGVVHDPDSSFVGGDRHRGTANIDWCRGLGVQRRGGRLRAAGVGFTRPATGTEKSERRERKADRELDGLSSWPAGEAASAKTK